MITTLILLCVLTVPRPVTAAANTVSTLSRVTNVRVSDVTVNEATIRWDRHNKALKYEVKIYNNDELVETSKTTRRRLNVTDLASATDYSVKVRALRGKKTGKWSKTVNFTTIADESLYDQYSAVSGNFSGDWQNITFGTTGDATTVVEVSPDGNASFTVDLGGFVFGLLDPAAKTYTSTYDDTGIVFTATDDDLFGDLSITIVVNDNDTAQITFSGVDVPVAGISSISADGTLYPDSLDMNYIITFSDESTAIGIFSLTKTESL
ncbi:MAG: hypothetical protein ACD_43C00014G0003 [uncultured bacterium]|nr:MAG: hypothetical protein ACD_43C00014G0003 [uncultured bacterium]